MAMTRDEYLESQRTYNLSAKGQARYKRYEDAHPERKENRWEPARNINRDLKEGK
jgi:hypothetical protein